MKYIIAILTVFLITGLKVFAAQALEAKATLSDIIIDVRTSDEYLDSHVKGALNIDIKAEGFEDQIVKLDKNRLYKLYCRSGNRSGKAIEVMKKKGFLYLENLGGLKDAVEKLHANCEGKNPC